MSKQYETKMILPEDIQEYLDLGWKIGRERGTQNF